MVVKKKVVKKAVKKKVTKQEHEEMELNTAKDELNTKKRVYGEYIKVLVKYNIKNVAYSAIMYDELYHTTLMRRLDSVEDKIGEFSKLIFGDKSQTKLERVKENTEYYDKLIGIVQGNIELMTDDVKTKIAKDAIEKKYAWLNIPE